LLPVRRKPSARATLCVRSRCSVAP
jgi:hypothetical protein